MNGGLCIQRSQVHLGLVGLGRARPGKGLSLPFLASLSPHPLMTVQFQNFWKTSPSSCPTDRWVTLAPGPVSGLD